MDEKKELFAKMVFNYFIYENKSDVLENAIDNGEEGEREEIIEFYSQNEVEIISTTKKLWEVIEEKGQELFPD